MIDRQVGKLQVSGIRIPGWSPRQCGQPDSGEGLGPGRLEQMRREGLLQHPAKIDRSFLDPGHRPQRKNPPGVDGGDGDWAAGRQRTIQSDLMKSGQTIQDHLCGISNQRRKIGGALILSTPAQPAGVGERRVGAGRAIRRHTFQNKAVEPVAGPAVTRAESLDHQQRSAEGDRPIERMVKGIVPRHAPVRGHPIQNEAPVQVGGEVIQSLKTQGRYGHGDIVRPCVRAHALIDAWALLSLALPIP